MKDTYKGVIASIIAHVLVILSVLAFVFGIVYITNNTGFLWLLFLLLTTELLPNYKFEETTTRTKQDVANDDPFRSEDDNETNI